MSEGEPEVLDACICINLAAALGGGPQDLRGCNAMIVPQVAREAMFLHDRDGDDVVVTPVILEGIPVLDLSDEENEMYIELARNLDDGEAASLAVAWVRGWALATDDRAAMRRALAMEPSVKITSTATLLRNHAEITRWDSNVIAGAVRAVRDRASFVPPRTDPEYGWWMAHLDPANGG